MSDRKFQPETLAIHAGQIPDAATGARALPIYQTTSFVFDSADHAASLFNLQTFGNVYTRLSNPTVAALEERVAALEGGRAALASASGMAAEALALLTLLEQGDHVVAAGALYGGSVSMLAVNLKKLGIETTFVDASSPESFAAAMRPATRAVFAESIGNPSLAVLDIAAVAEVAHAHGVPLIVDNTVPSPYLCRPFEHGADIVVHALTKYLGGHGTSLGGAIVDSGKFPWAEHKERFKRLNEPDVSYHGVVYTEAFGPAAYIGRARVVPLRNLGGALSPMNAFQILQGIETLPLRMDRICENSLRIAQHLQAHPKVATVNYAGLPEHPDHALVKKLMGGRASGIISFGLKAPDGRAAGARFQDALKLFLRLVNIGDAKSLACHPASTTHRQLGPQELAKAGVSENMVRLSVGIEHIDDLLEDLDQALAAV